MQATIDEKSTDNVVVDDDDNVYRSKHVQKLQKY